MALAGSGAISFANIRDEFSPGSNTSVSLSDYYRQGSKIRAKAGDNNATHLASDVPTSGALALSDYYGTGIGFQFTISSDATNQNLSTIFGDDYDLDYPKFVVINSGVTVGGTSTSTPAINVPSGGAGTITITNGGNIYGKGGAAGAVGGDAIVAATACNVVNNGNIKSGGGGGGNGGAGGSGVVAANASLNNFVDEGGTPYGSGNTPANNTPSWFTQYSSNLNGESVVTDRKWCGVDLNALQSGRVNNSWGFFTTSSSFRGSLANRGPFYCSFQLGTEGTYTLTSATITSTWGSGYGSPQINISTSNTSASQGQGGGTYTGGQTMNLSADTTYYLVGSLSNISGYTYLYYNNFDFSFSLNVNTITSGGSAGSGGAGASYNASAGSGGSGGSGGTNAGSGGSGGNGGALGAAGSNGTGGGNGSGVGISFPSTAPTNGSSGSSGGAAGKYINGQSNVTLTNNGTVAGNIA
tara:strand:+ start:2315 stop:3721 length:1407 start_codon:yes stop_codon:yes gene_type:complete